jgi:hypothetical protein
MGTLIGLRSPVGATYAAVAAEHGIDVAPAAIDRAFPGVLRQAPPLAFPGLEGDRLRLLLAADNDFLAPTLYLRGSDDTAPAPVEFPRAERAQDTWIIEVETPVPPLSASRNADQHIQRTT